MKEISAFTNKLDVYEIFQNLNFRDIKYTALNKKDKTTISGSLDEHGRTSRLNGLEEQEYEVYFELDGIAKVKYNVK